MRLFAGASRLESSQSERLQNSEPSIPFESWDKRSPRGKLQAGELMLAIPVVLLLLALGAIFGLGWNASGHAIHPGSGTYAWTLADYPQLAAQEVELESRTGASLRGRFFEGRTRAAVILVHGYGGNQDEMLPVAGELAEAGFSVFTYDQRGCGQSTGEVTFGAREQDDLLSVVDYVASRPDVDRDRIGALGFSMGGSTTLLAAAREPRIKAVAADSAWSDVRRWLRPSVAAVFTRPRDRFNALSLKLAEIRTGIDLDDLRPVDVAGRISPRPLLVIHGTADDVVLPSESERNYDAAKGPKELVLVPEAAHGDTLAPGEKSMHAEVREFFERALVTAKAAA
jgi:dipeptidyl aminopeptidase/acylaminoacyl peptidase